ncbi:MAG: T9SS type A sorting domain-containing protein [Saprospiraceae bacterium]|nr:T9SS type A sorting domain-containing protein [Saprospiraceae bacterium]
MKKIIFLTLLIPCVVFGQIQVSSIEYERPRDNYSQKGFMKVGEEEYFIERGLKGTKVSLVKDNELEFVHELNFRPTDGSINTHAISYENSNSGLHYDGELLYELYWEYIYVVDVVSGELKEVVDLKQYDLRLQRDFYVGENYYHFRALGIGWSGYIRLDRNTGEVIHLEDDGIVVDSKRYWMSADKSKVTYYDLEVNQMQVHPHEFSLIEFVRKHASDVNSRLIIKDENGIHLLRNDDSVHTISCSFPEVGELSYVSDNRMAYVTNNGTDVILSVIDLEDCSEVYTYSYIGAEGSLYLPVYSEALLFNEYFIFGFPSSWAGTGEFYLYDIERNEASFIDIPIDFPFLDRAVRYDDNLYFYTYNDIHYIGPLPELYQLDLDTYEVGRIGENEIYETYEIIIGEDQEEHELNVFYRTETTASLYQIDDNQQSLDQLKEFDLYQNHGIYYSVYADIWADDKYFFSTSSAIFVMEDDVTTKLTDIETYGFGSSAYARKGDYVYVLAKLDTAHYALKININDLSYSTTALPEIESITNKRGVSENAIVNLVPNLTFDGSSGFYDLESEKFISINELDLPLGTPNSLSGNTILFRSAYSMGGEYYLINTLTSEIIETEIEPNTNQEIFVDGVGGFYLLGELGEDEVFSYLDPQGKVEVIYNNFDYNVFYGGNRFSGKVKSLAIDGPDAMIIISVKDGEVRQKSIPDNGLLYYQSYYWYNSNNISFLELKDGTTYNTYMFSFDSEPENITLSGRDDRLVMVLEDETFAVLVYKNDHHVLSFEKYDYATGQMEEVAELPSVRNSFFDNAPYRIDDSRYLISLNDGIHGLEPWVYNMKTHELELLKDIHEGHVSGKIEDYTKNPIHEEVYFSAIKTEGDRQLFRLDRGLIPEVNRGKDIPYTLTVYPSPASSYIQLGKDYSKVMIYNASGTLVAQYSAYVKDSKISVEDYIDGAYLIQARLSDNGVESGKFIVKR